MGLIPDKYEKIFKREKTLKLSFAFVVLLATLVLSLVVFMLPSYFVLVFSEEDVLRRLKAAEEVFEKKELKNTEALVRTVNTSVSIYEKNEKRKKELSSLLIKLFNATPPEVKVSSINLQRDEKGIFEMSINGFATKREDFLKYMVALEKNEAISSIDSPITNLLKETDAIFKIGLKIKPEFYSYVGK